jgi:histidinol dehydrogenase
MISWALPRERKFSISAYVKTVSEIVEEVRSKGDRALLDLTQRFDGVKLDSVNASRRELEEQSAKLPSEVKESISRISSHLESYHQMIKPAVMGEGIDGVRIDLRWVPLKSVGIYVPGGKASYPSTLLMASIPARVAGVKEIYVSTPSKEGRIDPAIAYIVISEGVEEVYKVGGAQAIAALAYGTETVKRVDKIVGPGNVYVQAAKYLVSLDVGIDGVEGPTELVVIADESASPRRVALDLQAQAEHGPMTTLALISTSPQLLEDVASILGSDSNVYSLVKVGSIAEAIEIANQIAPEHLSLHVKDAEKYVNEVVNAGVVTLGDTAPALVDYCAGVSHVLPTNGWSRFKSGLSVFDFLKALPAIKDNSIRRELVRAAEILARYEGFRIHASSIGARYGGDS